MYIECAKKVAEKNAQDPTKGSTVILNELLADDVWLAQVSFYFFQKRNFKFYPIVRGRANCMRSMHMRGRKMGLFLEQCVVKFYY